MRRARRAAAIAALLGVVLALLPRPAAAAPAHECPPPASGAPALAPAPQHCEHAQPGPCGDMLGCLATPPAMLAVAAGVLPFDGHPAALVTPAPKLHGRLALGPPTPPPNC